MFRFQPPMRRPGASRSAPTKLDYSWKPPARILIVDYLKKHKRVKRSDLYFAIKGFPERTLRCATAELVKEGIVIEDPCECGHTAFIELA